jgi:serine protease Do
MKRFVAVLGLLLISQTIYSASMETLSLQEDAFNKVACEVGPAVVSVTVVQVYTYGGRTYYYPYRSYDPFLDEFLREFFESPREYRQSGLGSGVIIDEKGYILTNEHVVNGANEIEVTLSDGRKFKGVVKGADPRSDLAVIKIDADNLPIAKLGDSEKVRVGEWVVAMGNPFGFVMSNPQPTITAGIVSALHRSFSYTGLDQVKYYGDLIQTDAAINKGNSGGPLVNLRGEVIGINALIYSTTGGYQGIGFAIPINRAKKILEELISGKEIKYGWLGVQVQSLTPELISQFNLSSNKGALIAEVIRNSPADKGGIKQNDIIMKVNNKEIIASDDLVATISHFEVGQKVGIDIVRHGKDVHLEVVIGERPKDINT